MEKEEGVGRNGRKGLSRCGVPSPNHGTLWQSDGQGISAAARPVPCHVLCNAVAMPYVTFSATFI